MTAAPEQKKAADACDANGITGTNTDNIILWILSTSRFVAVLMLGAELGRILL